MNWLFEAVISHRKKSPQHFNIFGVILYSDIDANIKKVLSDEDYWLALDILKVG
jgi:hypothetical protein